MRLHLLPPPLSQRDAPRPRRPRRWRQLALGLAFTSPWTIGFLWLTAGPMLLSLYESFTTYNLILPPAWVGLDNYRALLADPLFITAVGNTLYLVAVMVPATALTALAVGLLMHRAVRGRGLYRTVLYLPSLLPPVGGALLALWLLQPRYGLVNAALGLLHVSGPLWFDDPAWAKPGLVLLGVWGAGSAALVVLAALQGVPRELYEQATIDCATPGRQLLHVTLPHISPAIFFNLVIGTLGALQYFDAGYVVGRASPAGGAGNALLFLTVYLYRTAFGYFRMGYASAMAWALLLLGGLLVGALFASQRWWVFYG